MGEKVFGKIQYGKEVTKGTAVVATAMFPGQIVVPSDRKVMFPRYATGRKSGAIASQINQYLVDGATLGMEAAVFEKLPLFFSCGLKGNITATEVTAGQADYLWAFAPTLTAAGTYDALTIEYGDDTEQYEVEFCMFRSIKISGKVGADEPVKVEGTFFGRQISDSAFTAALTPGTLTPMIANSVKIYIDSTWATLGSTIKSGLLREYSIEIITGLHPKFMGDGQLYFSTYGEGELACIADFKFEGNSEADAQWDAWRAQTNRAIRLLIEGPQIGSGEKNKLQIDMFGKWEDVHPLDSEEEGNNLHSAVLNCMDDNQATAHILDVNVICDSNAI